MDKANEFEHGIDKHMGKRHFNFTDFTVESNLHYKYESADDLISQPDVLAKMIKDHHDNQTPRLEVLDEYFKAKNSNIRRNQRRKEEEKADHRPAHNFAKIGCQFDVGYNTGIPIKTEFDEADEHNDSLRDFNTLNDTDGLNSEVWLDMDKYGRAYELHYRNSRDEDRVVISNVFETFVVYDTTVERNPILAVRYPKAGFTKDETRVRPIVYTENEIIEYQTTTLSHVDLREEYRYPHDYGTVPVTEAQPNRYRQGLYEDVLSLIDLYDSAQADTANYMTDLNDAMLVISGDVDATGMTTDDLIKQKNANIMVLESGVDINGNKTSVSAGYIYKQYDVQGAEAYKDRLVTDIHKLMNVPDLSDSNFSGTQSGESMKYKLFGFDQMTATKQRLFDQFLRQRYELVFNIKNSVNEVTDVDLNDLSIRFTPNLPKAIKEELEMLTGAGAQFSQQTLYGLASFVESGEAERKLIDDERKLPEYDFELPIDEEGDEQILGEAAPDVDKEVLKALNGAQITSVLSILQQMKEGLLNANQAKALLVEGLKLDEETVNRIVGD